MDRNEDYGYWPAPPVPDDDLAWTAKEKRNLRILVIVMTVVASVCCGAGVALGVALA